MDGSQRRHSTLRNAVEAEGTVQGVGEADTGEEAMRLARTLTPDVVLHRLQVPDERGRVLLCREVNGLTNPPLVVLYHRDREYDGLGGLACPLSEANGLALCMEALFRA